MEGGRTEEDEGEGTAVAAAEEEGGGEEEEGDEDVDQMVEAMIAGDVAMIDILDMVCRCSKRGGKVQRQTDRQTERGNKFGGGRRIFEYDFAILYCVAGWSLSRRRTTTAAAAAVFAVGGTVRKGFETKKKS